MMRFLNILIMLVLFGGVAFLYDSGRFGARGDRIPGSPDSTKKSQNFRCMGKVHCSEMVSCEEATFYLNNCPRVRIDGDGDGIPCERQWCGG